MWQGCTLRGYVARVPVAWVYIARAYVAGVCCKVYVATQRVYVARCTSRVGAHCLGLRCKGMLRRCPLWDGTTVLHYMHVIRHEDEGSGHLC